MSTVLGLQLGRARTMIRADEYCIIRPSDELLGLQG